jgi:hypothetical protein
MCCTGCAAVAHFDSISRVQLWVVKRAFGTPCGCYWAGGVCNGRAATNQCCKFMHHLRLVAPDYTWQQADGTAQYGCVGLGVVMFRFHAVPKVSAAVSVCCCGCARFCQGAVVVQCASGISIRATGQVLYSMARCTSATNQSIGFSIEPCGRHLATGGCDGAVRVRGVGVCYVPLACGA